MEAGADQQHTEIQSEDVIAYLTDTMNDTAWAGRTNVYALYSVSHISKIPDSYWKKVSLSQDEFFSILLQPHSHAVDADSAELIFPGNIPLSSVLDFYTNTNSLAAQKCMEEIQGLKKSILEHGFTSTIVLSEDEGQLRHLDGLHRVLALVLAMKEGYEYVPISAFVHSLRNSINMV